MPPKKNNAKQGGAPKVKVDKTFGLPNKSGSKAQKQIKVIQSQQSQSGMDKEAQAKARKKEEEKRLKAEAERLRKAEGELFAIVQPKVPFGSGE